MDINLFLFVIVFVLAILLVYQQFFFLRQIQTLVDKLMSRDFDHYNAAVKPRGAILPIKLPVDAPEDLGTLQAFTS